MTTAAHKTHDESVEAIHNRLFFRLFQAGNTLDRQTVKELGITTVQWSVLGALSRPQVANGMAFTALADYLVVSRQSLDGVLKRLERESHVKRVADPSDRRARNVVLTAVGRKFWDGLQPRIYEFYRQAVTAFRFDDKVALAHFLTQLNEGISSVQLSSTGAPREKAPGRRAPVARERGAPALERAIGAAPTRRRHRRAARSPAR